MKHCAQERAPTRILSSQSSPTDYFEWTSASNRISIGSMAKLKFDLPAPLESAVVFTKIKKLLSGDNDFRKFDPKAVCTFDEASKKCVIKGSQFEALLQIQSKGSSASNINISVELPLAAMLFKGKIQEMLEKNLKKIL
jgi:hypothetical protein